MTFFFSFFSKEKRGKNFASLIPFQLLRSIQFFDFRVTISSGSTKIDERSIRER